MTDVFQKRWLLLRPDKAGDAIKTLPALRALRELSPEVSLHVLSSSHNASLFEFEPGIRLHRLPADWESREKHGVVEGLVAAGMPEEFDVAVSLLGDRVPSVERLLEALTAKERLAVGMAEFSPLDPLTRIYLPGASPQGRDESLNISLILDRLKPGVAQAFGNYARAPILGPDDLCEADHKMGRKDGRWLGFCPFAGTDQRSFPLEKWRRFIRNATKSEHFSKFFLFGTAAHLTELRRFQSLSSAPERTEICFPSSFRALGAYLNRLDAVVAIDSGPLHLARALEIPSLGFLSGGDAHRWFGQALPKSQVLRRGLFSRYPSQFSMRLSFDRWVRNF